MTSIHNQSYFTQVNTIPRSRHCQERSVPKFLKKLFSMLEENSFNKFISWSEDGTAVVIKQPTEFAVNVLPMFFKHSNFSSFIRQLNMYNFKKSKNRAYDHIYTHQMFQSGRVELLRNIQRKTAEMGTDVSVDSQFLLKAEEVDVDSLIEENLRYKKLHKDLTTQIEYIEKKMCSIKNEVSQLYSEQQNSAANEKFLKGILKSLTKVYGFESIVKIIENDAEEGSELPLMIHKADFQENCSNANNKSLSHVPESNYEEDGFLEKSSELSPEDQTNEYSSTNDTPQQLENIQPQWNQGELMERQPLFALDFGFNVNYNNNDDCDVVVSPKLTKIDSYAIWVDELKNKEYNTEMLFGQSNKRFSQILNFEDF